MDRIQLVSKSVYADLVPADTPASARAGFAAFKIHCLSCHHLQGVGGRKVDKDMKQLVTGKSRGELRTWIDDPKTIRPGTTMPPFNDKLDDEERERVIDQIVDYLELL